MNENKKYNSEFELAQALLSPYVDDEVTPDERELVERWLAKSPALQVELDNLKQTVNLLADLPRVPAPRPFTLSEADVGPVPAESAPTTPWWQTWLKPLMGGVSAVAAVLLFVVLFNLTLRPPTTETTDLAMAPAQTPEIAQEAVEAPAEMPATAPQAEAELAEEPASTAVAETAETAEEEALGDVDAEAAPLALEAAPAADSADSAADPVESVAGDMAEEMPAEEPVAEALEPTAPNIAPAASVAEDETLDMPADDGGMADSQPAPAAPQTRQGESLTATTFSADMAESDMQEEASEAADDPIVTLEAPPVAPGNQLFTDGETLTASTVTTPTTQTTDLAEELAQPTPFSELPLGNQLIITLGGFFTLLLVSFVIFLIWRTEPPTD